MLHQLGEVRRLLERLREAEALAERLNDDRRRGRVCVFIMNIHSLFGELDAALVTGTRALEIAGRLGDLRLRILTTTLFEQAHYWRGEYERAVELATDNLAALPADWVYEYFGLTAPASVNDRFFLVMSLAQLGRFGEAADYATEDALAFAGRALTLARERGQRPYEAWALRLLGEITAHGDPPEHADSPYRDALALAEELGMRPLVAHCHLGLGKLSRRTGKREQARDHLATATTMYREMDMGFWLEKAEAVMKELR